MAFISVTGAAASTALRGTTVGTTAFAGVAVAASPPPPPAVAAAASRRVTAPSMNLFDRLSRIVRASVNDAVSSAEDPEKLLTQAVADMQNDIVKVRQAYAEVSASTKRLERQREAASTSADEWYKRAQLALQAGEEQLAREALGRRNSQMETVSSLDAQLGGMRENVSKLHASLTALEAKVAEARTKKDQFVARAKTAKTSADVNSMLSGMGEGSAMEAFERMSVKVEELETKADVAAEMAIGGSADVGLEGKFKALESSSVDDELAALKGSMAAASDPYRLPGTTGSTGSTGSAGSKGASGNPPSAMDSELDRMRKDLGR
ncbi:hypothetical protein MMPV_000211 [Pyropia vietnamensis]